MLVGCALSIAVSSQQMLQCAFNIMFSPCIFQCIGLFSLCRIDGQGSGLTEVVLVVFGGPPATLPMLHVREGRKSYRLDGGLGDKEESLFFRVTLARDPHSGGGRPVAEASMDGGIRLPGRIEKKNTTMFMFDRRVEPENGRQPQCTTGSEADAVPSPSDKRVKAIDQGFSLR